MQHEAARPTEAVGDLSRLDIYPLRRDLQAGATLAELRAQLQKAETELAAMRAEMAATLARRDIEDRRLRAAGAARAEAARATADELRVRMADILATADEHAAESLRNEVRKAQAAMREVTAERDRLLASTSWCVTWPLRAAGRSLSPALRRRVRQGLNAVWWTVSGQLGAQMRRRRVIVEETRMVAASPLFDGSWYSAHHPDVAATGLDPAMHYVIVGAPEGRDPGPGFSVKAYQERHPEAVWLNRPALLHSLDAARQAGNGRLQ